MTAWMEYLYMQQPKPNDVTGVSVHLTAIDSTGRTQDIGSVVTDEKGNFMTSWTPSAEGLYKIVADFDGTKSYYNSDAETGLVVSNAAATAAASPSPSMAVQPPTSSTPATTYIAIGAVAVIIVVVALAVLLRRRK
jgi:hypothetical protein